MKRIGRCKACFNGNQNVINAYNKMHFGYRVQWNGGWWIEKEMETIDEKA